MKPALLAYGDAEDLETVAVELANGPSGDALSLDEWRQIIAEGATVTCEDFGLVRRRMAAALDAVFGAWVVGSKSGPGPSADAVPGGHTPGPVVAASGPWKWPTRRGRKMAGASTDRERKLVEDQERTRWVKALSDLIVSAGLPLAVRLSDSPRESGGRGGSAKTASAAWPRHVRGPGRGR